MGGLANLKTVLIRANLKAGSSTASSALEAANLGNILLPEQMHGTDFPGGRCNTNIGAARRRPYTSQWMQFQVQCREIEDKSSLPQAQRSIQAAIGQTAASAAERQTGWLIINVGLDIEEVRQELGSKTQRHCRRDYERTRSGLSQRTAAWIGFEVGSGRKKKALDRKSRRSMAQPNTGTRLISSESSSAVFSLNSTFHRASKRAQQSQHSAQGTPAAATAPSATNTTSRVPQTPAPTSPTVPATPSSKLPRFLQTPAQRDRSKSLSVDRPPSAASTFSSSGGGRHFLSIGKDTRERERQRIRDAERTAPSAAELLTLHESGYNTDDFEYEIAYSGGGATARLRTRSERRFFFS
ncbi:hypothetical protein C8R44DRAFT_860997 [Mycena epipterygia]|nr:hypothetical protein C8R44DRAFT_860997 [Mycena epipterygia]